MPTGVEVPAKLRRPYQCRPMRLIYAGRVVQTQKRVMDFAPLVEALARRGVDFRFTIAGQGRDRSSSGHTDRTGDDSSGSMPPSGGRCTEARRITTR